MARALVLLMLLTACGGANAERIAADDAEPVATENAADEAPRGSGATEYVPAKARIPDGAIDRVLLDRALAIDPDAKPEWRLENLVMQRRARWLLAREDELFLTADKK